jgi:hypothetical protein
MSHRLGVRLSSRISSKEVTPASRFEVNNRKRPNYCVAYIGATGGVRRNFAQFEAAKREANNIVQNLVKGDMEALKLTGEHKQCYVEAEC